MAAACAPFKKLDAQVCSGNCESLEDYPAHCGDPGLPTSYKSETCLRPSVWGKTGQVRKAPSSQAGPEAGPTSAFYSCVPTGVQGPTCTVWTNLTRCLLQGAFAADALQCGKDELYDWVDEFKQIDVTAAGPAAVERHSYWTGQFVVFRLFPLAIRTPK